MPGYDAPSDTVGPATRFTTVLLGILADASRAGRRPQSFPSLSPAAFTDIDRLRIEIAADIDTEWLAAGLRAWTGLMGLISFIRFGHLHNVVLDNDAYFDDALEKLGRGVIGDKTNK